MNKRENVISSVQILSIDAKDLYNANSMGVDYTVKYQDGSTNYKKYINTLDYSLDLIKLRESYYNKYRNQNFGFFNSNKKRGLKNKEYTNHVINVTFNYAFKEYNQCGRNTFVKKGYNINDLMFDDNICIIDGEIVGIKINTEITKNKLSDDITNKYFTCKKIINEKTGLETLKYVQTKNIKTTMSVKQLREYLYTNGFTLDGVRYIRWKRSSGSARVGKCLFINESLYKSIHKWDLCGLNIKNEQEIDLAAFEGAVSLSLSSIIDTVEIKPEEILVIDDYDSMFEDTVAGVTLKNGWLECKTMNALVKNSIWDGQALLDGSVFGEKYKNRGMLLLRNRFFKSCGFQTNIQKWFHDNNITNVDQLNGFTLATDVSQIKMITTPSSIKYMKFSTLKKWLRNIDSTFGIVKYDKPTQYFNGQMVQIHYQLLNTLQLSYQDMEIFLRDTLDYINMVKNDPYVLRFHIKYPNLSLKDSEYNSKDDIIFALMGLNEKFVHTKYYQDFKTDLITSMIKNVRRGHVLVKGTYATLFGNGLEMLKASIGNFNGVSDIGIGNIYSKMFQSDKEILCTRSPHIVAGNIYLARNKRLNAFDKYFKLSKEIVCVNAIGENIQQRANGCDYDSDTFALIDNTLLIERAKYNYDKFLVPTSFVDAKKIERTYTSEQLADLDIKTSVNKIGENVNTSQELNSLFWSNIYKGKCINELQELYHDICILAVLSGIEIDKAKKEYEVETGKEIEKLKSKYNQTIIFDGEKKTRKPMFFKMITMENGYKLNPKNKYEYWHTPMDYLQKLIGKYCYNNQRGKKKNFKYSSFADILKPIDRLRATTEDKKEFINIINILRSFHSEIKNIYASEYYQQECWNKSKTIKENRECYMEEIKINKPIAYLLFKAIDNREYRDVRNQILQILFGMKNSVFFEFIEESREKIGTLKWKFDGDIKLYDFNFHKNEG